MLEQFWLLVLTWEDSAFFKTILESKDVTDFLTLIGINVND